jgi:hypothetical protein
MGIVGMESARKFTAKDALYKAWSFKMLAVSERRTLQRTKSLNGGWAVYQNGKPRGNEYRCDNCNEERDLHVSARGHHFCSLLCQMQYFRVTTEDAARLQ